MVVLCELLEARIKGKCPSVKTCGVAMGMDEIQSARTGMPGVSVFYKGDAAPPAQTTSNHQRLNVIYGLQIVVKPDDLETVLSELRKALFGWYPEVEGRVFESFELHSTEIRDGTGSHYWYEQQWRIPEHVHPDPSVNL